MIERYNIRMFKYCPKCRTSEYKSDVGAWVKYEDHAAEIKKLLPVVKFAARFSCDMSLYGTLPDCSDQYPDQRDTHWCVGCTARDALNAIDSTKRA
jgi:hypothetical protein